MHTGRTGIHGRELTFRVRERAKMGVAGLNLMQARMRDSGE